jgi:hypothetical protein
MAVMRKRYRILVFAALVAALIVPVGYALSTDATQNKSTRTQYAAVIPAAATAVAAPVLMIDRRDNISSPAPFTPLSDATKLLCIGTALFGLAAAVRKAS